MARKVDTIQAAMVGDVVTMFTALANDNNISPSQKTAILAFITNTSKRSIWRLLTAVASNCVALNEQQMDILVAEIEADILLSAPATPNWLQDKALNYFQYSATTPQIVQLVNFLPKYPIEDPSLRIITRCSVRTVPSSNVLIKVAKGASPVALLPAESAALQNFYTTIGDAGINYKVSSMDGDLIYIKADIYFQGQYSAIISTNVVAAINDFLAYLSTVQFDGLLKISDLERAIRNVTGVNDVVLHEVKVRNPTSAPTWSMGIYLVNNDTLLIREYNPISGYILPETQATYTFSTTLNYIAE